jgi:hypothetical protein
LALSAGERKRVTARPIPRRSLGGRGRGGRRRRPGLARILTGGA